MRAGGDLAAPPHPNPPNCWAWLHPTCPANLPTLPLLRTAPQLQAAAAEQAATLQRQLAAAGERADAAEHARAEAEKALLAVQLRMAELARAGIGTDTIPAAHALAIDAGEPFADGRVSKGSGRMVVTPLLSYQQAGSRKQQAAGATAPAAVAGMPPVIAAGKWVLAAGAAALLGTAVTALAGGRGSSAPTWPRQRRARPGREQPIRKDGHAAPAAAGA